LEGQERDNSGNGTGHRWKEADMRLSLLVLILVLTVACVSPYEAGARPKAGDKTLSIGMTDFTYTTGSWDECDGDGDNCETYADFTDMHIGVGATGGYLFTDMLEVGMGIAIHRYSTDVDYESIYHGDYTYSEWMFGGLGYGKVHLGGSPTMVPFIAGGLELDLWWDEYDPDYAYYATLDDDKVNGSAALLVFFAEFGVDYYIAEKYGISGSLRITRSGFACDDDTDDDDNPIEASGRWDIRLGLGISTYF
jgi:hypothetical protein